MDKLRKKFLTIHFDYIPNNNPGLSPRLSSDKDFIEKNTFVNPLHKTLT